MKRNWKRFISIIGIMVVVLLLVYAGLRLRPTPAPEQRLPSDISGLQLEREYSGKEAQSIVKRSHLGSLKRPEETSIGYYQEGLAVWLSEYRESEAASREAERMSEAIEKFARGFSAPQKVVIDGQNVYRTLYQGRFQYFWSKGRFLVYVDSGPLGQDDLVDLVRKLP